MVVPAQTIGVARTASQRRSGAAPQRDVGVDPPQQQRELLAAPAGQQLVGGELAGEPPRELDQHRVAGRVPVDVVDLLEVVGVEQQQRAALRVERALGGHELGEVAPVVAPGQLVGARQQLGLPVRAAQLLLQAPALGHVARHAVVEQRAVLRQARAQPVVQDPLDAVDAGDPVLELDRLARRQAPQGGGPALAVVGMQQRCPHRLVLGHRPADQRLAMRAPVDRDAAAVGEDLERVEVIVHRLDHARDGGVRGRQVQAHLALLGDVGDDAADLDGAVGAAPRLRAVVDPARDPVGTAQPVLDVGLAPGAELEVEGVIGLAVVGMDRRVPVDHVGIGLGPAQQAVGARALEELLQAAVAVGDRQVDVLADDVEQAREALAGLGGACVRLGADRDVGEDPVHAHAAVRAADRAGPVAEGAHHAVQAGHAVGRVRILAAQQPAVEPRVLGPVVGVDHRLPQRAGLGARGHRRRRTAARASGWRPRRRSARPA